MTTQQLEKLRLIDAHLEHLLDIASKRTPGEWVRPGPLATHITCDKSENFGKLVCDCPDSTPDCSQYGRDTTFIASCAGNAEAGWRATRAMIEFALMVIEFHSTRPKEDPQRTELETVEEVAMRILAAFPLETINPKQP
jgi:hypothetical protein